MFEGDDVAFELLVLAEDFIGEIANKIYVHSIISNQRYGDAIIMKRSGMMWLCGLLDQLNAINFEDGCSSLCKPGINLLDTYLNRLIPPSLLLPSSAPPQGYSFSPPNFYL